MKAKQTTFNCAFKRILEWLCRIAIVTPKITLAPNIMIAYDTMPSRLPPFGHPVSHCLRGVQMILMDATGGLISYLYSQLLSSPDQQPSHQVFNQVAYLGARALQRQLSTELPGQVKIWVDALTHDFASRQILTSGTLSPTLHQPFQSWPPVRRLSNDPLQRGDTVTIDMVLYLSPTSESVLNS
jgi:hypothetical protein